jgi:hypothetical protein
MRYIDHYEIEFRSPETKWEHAGNVYPHYEWMIERPWWLLGLVRRPRITNYALAALTAKMHANNAAIMYVTTGPTAYFRIWQWTRRGYRLRKRLLDVYEGTV